MNGNKGDQGSGDEAPVEKGLIFGNGVEPRIIKSKDAPGLSVDEIYQGMYNCSSILCEIRDDGEAAVENEIVVGDSTRPITAKAKAALDNGFKKLKRDWEDRGLDTDFLLGYAVYSDGKSVAIVWSDERASLRL